jgi:Zn-dependent protease with chaperone function
MKHARHRHTLVTAFIALALAGFLVGIVAAATITGLMIDAQTHEPRP